MSDTDPWLRVKDKSTGYYVSRRQSSVDAAPDSWLVLKQDAVDHNGDPLPAEFPGDTGGDAESGSAAQSNTKTEKKG